MEPQPTLDQLRIFIAVAEAGSFSAAARRLGRAQSVVSYAIANLEAQLEVALFERGGARPPRLTAAGAALLQDARRMAAALQQLRARVKGLRQGLEAELCLAVDVLVPMPVLTAVLCAFRERHPTVAVRLEISALGGVWERVQAGRADLGIAGERIVPLEEVAARQIGAVGFVPVAAPGHPLAALPGPVPLAEVREHLQVVVSDPTDQSRGRDFGVFGLQTWRVTDVAAKRALLLAGLGWGGLPEWLVAEDLAAGRLVALSLEPYPHSRFPLYALRGAAAAPGPAAAWMAERFEAELAAFTAAEAG